MATIGVSCPYYATYNHNEDTGTVSYSNGGVLGKMTEVDVTINTSEDNNLYADNGIAETDRQFTDGQITLGTDDLSQAVSKAILGLKEAAVGTADGITDTDAMELIYDDSMANPYLGVGFVIKRQKNNVVGWRAVVFPKVMFNVPDESATTQGEQIEWQTPSLVATILRDDTETHVWKRSSDFTTEAQAKTYIKLRLGITDTPVSGGTVEQAASKSAPKSGASV